MSEAQGQWPISKKIIILIVVLGAALVFIFQKNLYPAAPTNSESTATEQTQSEEVRLLSTTPGNLEGSVVLPTQVFSLTFSHPIENTGEFKHRFEPEVPHTLKLSDDKKVLTIAGDPNFQVGVGYTLHISNETKFEGGKRLRDTQYVHFRTINYRGI